MALKDYSKALEIDPNNIRAINNIAILYVDQKRYNLAVIEYTRAIKLANLKSIDSSRYYRSFS